MYNRSAEEKAAHLRKVLEEYATIKDAARELNLAPTSLRGRVVRGTILSVRGPGSAVLIPKAEITRLRQTYTSQAS